MKFLPLRKRRRKRRVVPLAGTWVEISWYTDTVDVYRVVPLAGTWVEIALPPQNGHGFNVVPLAGTWVEIGLS